MVCRIADNPALERLRADIGAERLCHSQRVDCIHRLPRSDEQGYYGIAGAFMGYCQALFSPPSLLAENTIRIMSMLESEGLPWARSHELFYGHKGALPIEDYVRQAAAPLRHLGRVPILITGLNPARDATALDEIFEATPQLISGETILVRIIVEDRPSFDALEILVRGLVENAFASGKMPRWWPLVQSGSEASEWSDFRRRIGALWKYMNVAVSPFSPGDQWDIISDQIMVAQFVVPHEQDIASDGNVRLSDGMRISGATENASYNIRELVNRAGSLSTWPTSIFLGPTLPGWSDYENLRRVAKAVRIFTDEIQNQWISTGHDRYSELLMMAA